ncbi:MAG: PA2778 family cysteine peptidase [Pseudomonadota bacterium]|nr:PA2778 family cysteine peptidase [Pseudomonadota bacterium]
MDHSDRAGPSGRAFLRAIAGTLLLVVALGLSGCSINPSWQLAKTSPHEPALLLDVPFHPQTEYHCGPAALATTLGASGVAVAPEALAPQVFLPGREGSLQLELVAATRRAGRVPYLVEDHPDSLLAHLQDGRPVLVLQNLLTRSVPHWHYAVLVGSDPSRNRLVLNSGTQRGLEVSARKFLRTWDWAGRWGMVALQPGELPSHAEPAKYLAAVADFQAVAGHAAAGPAYGAALQRWPDDPRVHLALGNAAYASGDLPGAARHYRDGLTRAPADPVLGNNQASVLGELGCSQEAGAALRVAQQASPSDGRWSEALQETQDELRGLKAERSTHCDDFR